MSLVIAFQGAEGAYSDLTSRNLFPGARTLPCQSFEDAYAAVSAGKADRAVIPIENSTAGRVADIHTILRTTKLHCVGEYFLPVHHCLLAPTGATLKGLKTVSSHIQALSQCRENIKELGLVWREATDTAGAAKAVATAGDVTQAAIASSLAAELYGLDILRKDFQDAGHNTTRFTVWSQTADYPTPNTPCKMALLFKVRNVPAALYKALGGFATNGVNLVKLESYLTDGGFVSAQFYAELLGHPETDAVKLAMDELKFYTEDIRILGCFPVA